MGSTLAACNAQNLCAEVSETLHEMTIAAGSCKPIRCLFEDRCIYVSPAPGYPGVFHGTVKVLMRNTDPLSTAVHRGLSPQWGRR